MGMSRRIVPSRAMSREVDVNEIPLLHHGKEYALPCKVSLIVSRQQWAQGQISAG